MHLPPLYRVFMLHNMQCHIIIIYYTVLKYRRVFFPHNIIKHYIKIYIHDVAVDGRVVLDGCVGFRRQSTT